MAKILLAEDDNSMSDFLTMALAREGHDVTARNDGLEALAELKDNADYDLLLTDIVMPGMDAKQTEIGDTKVLSKPFHLKELVTQVDKILNVA